MALKLPDQNCITDRADDRKIMHNKRFVLKKMLLKLIEKKLYIKDLFRYHLDDNLYVKL